jgi:hypothetical protein
METRSILKGSVSSGFYWCLFFCILSDVNKEECRSFYKLVLHFEDAFIILATWGFHVLNEQVLGGQGIFIDAKS